MKQRISVSEHFLKRLHQRYGIEDVSRDECHGIISDICSKDRSTRITAGGRSSAQLYLVIFRNREVYIFANVQAKRPVLISALTKVQAQRTWKWDKKEGARIAACINAAL